MNILGVGGWELAAILIIMLIVAGPKRMVQWAYILGTYVAKLRAMWAETAALIQEELDQAGVDVKVPKDIPTRRDVNKATRRALTPFTDPLQQVIQEVDTDMKRLKEETKIPAGNGRDAQTNSPSGSSPSDFGTWSGRGKSDS
jgi:Sec-independent protein translocase protein TatA